MRLASVADLGRLSIVVLIVLVVKDLELPGGISSVVPGIL
jgi:hypothetical protein